MAQSRVKAGYGGQATKTIKQRWIRIQRAHSGSVTFDFFFFFKLFMYICIWNRRATFHWRSKNHCSSNDVPGYLSRSADSKIKMRYLIPVGGIEETSSLGIWNGPQITGGSSLAPCQWFTLDPLHEIDKLRKLNDLGFDLIIYRSTWSLWRTPVLFSNEPRQNRQNSATYIRYPSLIFSEGPSYMTISSCQPFKSSIFRLSDLASGMSLWSSWHMLHEAPRRHLPCTK